MQLGPQQCKSESELIKEDEQLRLCPKADRLGEKSVCYGFNLERGPHVKKKVEHVGANYHDVLDKGKCMTESQCEMLLDHDITWAKISKMKLFGTIKCNCADAVAVEMTYNMGEIDMSQFQSFIKRLKNKDWDGAAKSIEHSPYCRQDPKSCKRNARQIRACKTDGVIVDNVAQPAASQLAQKIQSTPIKEASKIQPLKHAVQQKKPEVQKQQSLQQNYEPKLPERADKQQPQIKQ